MKKHSYLGSQTIKISLWVPVFKGEFPIEKDGICVYVNLWKRNNRVYTDFCMGFALIPFPNTSLCYVIKWEFHLEISIFLFYIMAYFAPLKYRFKFQFLL